MDVAVRAKFTREELLSRANQWATTELERRRRAGRPSAAIDLLTPATFREMVKEGILPRATLRGRGRGSGHDALWSAWSYRRLLRVICLRMDGIHLRRYQRVILWLEGADVGLVRIRRDITAIARYQLNFIHRELRLDDRASEVFGATRRRRFEDRFARDGLTSLTAFGIDGRAILASLSFLGEFLSAPRLVTALSRLGSSALGEEPPVSVEEAAAALSPVLTLDEKILSELVTDLKAVANLLVPGDDMGDLVTSLERATDDTYRNVRDGVVRWNPYVRSFLILLQRILSEDPTVLGDFAVFRDQIIDALRALQAGLALPNPTARILTFCFFVRRAVLADSQGEGLGNLARLRVDEVLLCLAQVDPVLLRTHDDGALSAAVRATKSRPEVKERVLNFVAGAAET